MKSDLCNTVAFARKVRVVVGEKGIGEDVDPSTPAHVTMPMTSGRTTRWAKCPPSFSFMVKCSWIAPSYANISLLCQRSGDSGDGPERWKILRWRALAMAFSMLPSTLPANTVGPLKNDPGLD